MEIDEITNRKYVVRGMPRLGSAHSKVGLRRNSMQRDEEDKASELEIKSEDLSLVAKGMAGFRRWEESTMSKFVRRMCSIMSEKYPLDLGTYKSFQNLESSLLSCSGNHSFSGMKSEAIKY